MKAAKYLTSDEIKELLSIRHRRDIFFTELNTGFTGKEIRRFDAWAMKKSYTDSYTCGYEIKVSRADFLHDTKMQAYLKYCNTMYLVTVPDVIQNTQEIPQSFGWLQVQNFGNTYHLRTMQKAQYRDIEIPIDFWKSLIVNRSLQNKSYDKFADNRYHAQSAKEWLEGKTTFLDIGNKLGIEIADYKNNKKELASQQVIITKICRYLANQFYISTYNLNINSDLKDIKRRIDQRLKIKSMQETIDRLERITKDLKAITK